MASSRKAEPAAEPQFFVIRSLGKIHIKGLIMEQLEIIDLGDAMTETRCALTPAMSIDNLYGVGHVRC